MLRVGLKDKRPLYYSENREFSSRSVESGTDATETNQEDQLLRSIIRYFLCLYRTRVFQ